MSVRKKLEVVSIVVLGFLALATIGYAEGAASDDAAGAAECAAPDKSELTEPDLFADPSRDFVPASCTTCSECEDNGDCGSGSCVPIRQSVAICEEVCTLPSPVCHLSCKPCGQSACGPGEGNCVPVKQAFCIPEEECHLPAKVCNC